MTKKEIKEDDLVLCTVKKIESGSVFVDIENNGSGSIVLPEIAAGRIRNLRAFVVLNKRIVCKVLKISKGNVELSLRRVTAKEKEEVLEKYKKERNLLSMLKAVTSSPEKTLEKIKSKYDISDFLESARTNQKVIAEFIPKEEAEKLSSTLEEKQERQKTVKKTVSLKSFFPSGLLDIKEILASNQEGISAHYLGSSKFMIESSANSFKDAEHNLSSFIEEIERKAKNKKILFSSKDKN
jgi:translation initiation factor 2 alpha subunit (eIF-2alpha)